MCKNALFYVRPRGRKIESLKTSSYTFVFLTVWGSELAYNENFRWICPPEPAEIAFEYHRSFMTDSALMGKNKKNK